MALVLLSLWRNCGKRGWTAGFAPRSKHLINRLEHKQQWQFVLACGAVCHGRHGDQGASASQEACEHGSSALLEASNAHQEDQLTSLCHVGDQSLHAFKVCALLQLLLLEVLPSILWQRGGPVISEVTA